MQSSFGVKLLFLTTAVLAATCNAGSYRLLINRYEVIIDLRFAQGSSKEPVVSHQDGIIRVFEGSKTHHPLIETIAHQKAFQKGYYPALSLDHSYDVLNAPKKANSQAQKSPRKPSSHQEVLSPSPSKYTSGIIYWLVYTTNVQVGNPPQPFRAQVDLNWGDLFIPSVNCSKCWNNHLLYNSSQSSTYVPDLTPARVLHSGGNTWGNVSQDSLHVGGMEVRNQRFEEVTIWNTVLYDELIDGALGLARLSINDSQANVGAAYPFQNMVAQGLLDRNLFSLTLSPTRSDIGGELLFGAIDHESYTGELVTIPVSHVTGGADEDLNTLAASGWQVPIKSISIGSKDPTVSPVTAHFPHHTAVFVSGFPFITLPLDVINVTDIRRRLGVADDDEAVSCDKRSLMPNVTFTFGEDAKEIVLTPQDYLFEVENIEGPGTLCAIPFENLAPEDIGPGYVFLGSAFLGGLYSVFDAEDKTISCKHQTFPLVTIAKL